MRYLVRHADRMQKEKRANPETKGALTFHCCPAASTLVSQLFLTLRLQVLVRLELLLVGAEVFETSAGLISSPRSSTYLSLAAEPDVQARSAQAARSTIAE